ncbi:MAG: four helix bundle protein [Cyclobacteriaceae bacterium]|jgi:four helix bundle protein|nr:four helix bundle protein [Cyclobacteriaceae bacterium]
MAIGSRQNGNQSFRDLTVYKKAFALAMEIFEVSKSFPKEERYSLIDQIRRSSRAVCSCIAEAYRKRDYQAYFVSKSSDADMENSETQTWLDFAVACHYISHEQQEKLLEQSEEVGRLLNHMVENPALYVRKKDKSLA